jgi:hypothetical protein
VPFQFLAFVVAPPAIALVTRSLRAGLQTILWAYLFGAVATFPVYLVESIRVFQETTGLYLDGDLPKGATIGTNLNNAVAWLFLVVPSVMVPLGVLGTALAAAIAKACQSPLSHMRACQRRDPQRQRLRTGSPVLSSSFD